MAQMRKFYFDTALTASPNALPSLLAFADPHRITYGSDFPYADPATAAHFAGNLQSYPLDDTTRRAIHTDNALKLFPRFATALALRNAPWVAQDRISQTERAR